MSRTPLVPVLLALVLASTAGTAAAGGGGGGSACAGFRDGGAVVLRDSCFEGTAHFAGAEGTVRVTNSGRLAHTYTALDGSFDTGLLEPGQSAEVTAVAGVHRAVCKLHADTSGSGMAGVLIVGDLGEVAFATASTLGGGGGAEPEPGSGPRAAAASVGALLLLVLSAGAGAVLRRRTRRAALPSS